MKNNKIVEQKAIIKDNFVVLEEGCILDDLFKMNLDIKKTLKNITQNGTNVKISRIASIIYMYLHLYCILCEIIFCLVVNIKEVLKIETKLCEVNGIG